MELFLSKLIPLFIYPLGAAIVLALIALVLTFGRHARLGRFLLAITIIALWTASTPIFANWIVFELERQYPPRPIAELPSADAAILLGGILSQPLPPRITADLADSSDRIVEALRIFQSGKASTIVIAGGNLPWERSVAPESALLADLLVELGVPRASLIVETQSRNTYENARNVAWLFALHELRTGLLVTSGMHMPRALAAFREAGLDVTPAATDIHATLPLLGGPLDFLPDANALALSSAAIKEIIGGWAYRYRGWALG